MHGIDHSPSARKPVSPEVARPRLYHRNRSRILRSTFEHLIGNPCDRLTYPLVSSLTGLSRPTIYNHFASIEALQSAAFAAGLSPLAAALQVTPATSLLPPIQGCAIRLSQQLCMALYLAAMRARVAAPNPVSWLEVVFNDTVRRPQLASLHAAVRSAAAHSGRRIWLDAAAADRFLISLERRFLLPQLLPGPEADLPPVHAAAIEAELLQLIGARPGT